MTTLREAAVALRVAVERVAFTHRWWDKNKSWSSDLPAEVHQVMTALADPALSVPSDEWRAGWRAGVEAAAKVADESSDSNVSLFHGHRYLPQYGERGIGTRIRSLSPPEEEKT